jgi:hypothetical protein
LISPGRFDPRRLAHYSIFLLFFRLGFPWGFGEGIQWRRGFHALYAGKQYFNRKNLDLYLLACSSVGSMFVADDRCRVYSSIKGAGPAGPHADYPAVIEGTSKCE